MVDYGKVVLTMMELKFKMSTSTLPDFPSCIAIVGVENLPSNFATKDCLALRMLLAYWPKSRVEMLFTPKSLSSQNAGSKRSG